jgi:hypothetical protein
LTQVEHTTNLTGGADNYSTTLLNIVPTTTGCIVAVISHRGGTLSTPSLVINGSSAGLGTSTAVNSANFRIGIYAWDLSSVGPSTTGELTVFHGSGTVAHGRFAVWQCIGISAASGNTYTDSDSDPLTASINVPARGVAIAGAKGYRASNYLGTTWTNLTEDFDEASSELATEGESGASAYFSTQQTGLSISADIDSVAATERIMVALALSPLSGW